MPSANNRQLTQRAKGHIRKLPRRVIRVTVGGGFARPHTSRIICLTFATAGILIPVTATFTIRLRALHPCCASNWRVTHTSTKMRSTKQRRPPAPRSAGMLTPSARSAIVPHMRKNPPLGMMRRTTQAAHLPASVRAGMPTLPVLVVILTPIPRRRLPYTNTQAVNAAFAASPSSFTRERAIQSILAGIRKRASQAPRPIPCSS